MAGNSPFAARRAESERPFHRMPFPGLPATSARNPASLLPINLGNCVNCQPL